MRKTAGAAGAERKTDAVTGLQPVAAREQAGGEAELLYSPSKMSRDDALSQVRQDAREKAINLGADPDSIRIISMEETRLAYMADDSVRLKARAVGDLSGVREAGP